jgi:nucleoside permease NupC
MQKKLQDFLDDVYLYSENASTVNRQLSFAGIAILWIYKNPENSPVVLVSELVLPLLLWVISLGLDLIQYLFGTIAWLIFFERKEKKFNSKDLKNPNNLTSPIWITRTIDVIFVFKCLTNIVAYCELIKFFLPKISL